MFQMFGFSLWGACFPEHLKTLFKEARSKTNRCSTIPREVDPNHACVISYALASPQCPLSWGFGTPSDMVSGYHIAGYLICPGVPYHHVPYHHHIRGTISPRITFAPQGFGAPGDMVPRVPYHQ